MNFVPINGLRLMLVESCILLAAFALVFAITHFFHPSLRSPRWLRWILSRNSRAVLVVVVSALCARALLLPVVGIPEPRINDEYSYLLMADTFAHYRLTNPTPPAWPHFETFHVNMTPTYHSKYPVSQGLALAFGQVIFHQPWVGVYLSTALMCGAICWCSASFCNARVGVSGRIIGGRPDRSLQLLDELLLGRLRSRARRGRCVGRGCPACSSLDLPTGIALYWRVPLRSPYLSLQPHVPMKASPLLFR